MVNKDLLKEIKFIIVCSLFMDIVLVAAASLFVSFVQAMTGAVQSIEDIDFEGLNKAIQDLQDAVGPFAKTMRMFK